MEGRRGWHLNLALEVLGHEAARAVHGYQVLDADVNAVVRVVKPLGSCRIVLQRDVSNAGRECKAQRVTGCA